MSGTVSGGKTLHLPGVSSKNPEFPEQLGAVSISKKRWLAMIACVSTLTLLPGVVYFSVSLPIFERIISAENKITPSSAGFTFPAEDMGIPIFALTFTGFLFLSCMFTMLVAGKTSLLTKSSERGLKILFATACILFTAQAFGILNTPMFKYHVGSTSAFSQWATAKYNLADIDTLVLHGKKATLTAHEKDGSETTMKVYWVGRTAYLYQTDAELNSIKEGLPK